MLTILQNYYFRFQFIKPIEIFNWSLNEILRKDNMFMSRKFFYKYLVYFQCQIKNYLRS